MGYRESILTPHGYRVTYVRRPGYRGSDPKDICIAEINGVTYYPFKDPGHYGRIRAIQDRIPHMARFTDTIDDVILMEAAPGTLLWEIDSPPDPSIIATQLTEFADATRDQKLIHGDVRPWNVVVNGDVVRIIDWNLSRFVDDLSLGDDVLRA